jgi:cytochrome c peroxidase
VGLAVVVVGTASCHSGPHLSDGLFHNLGLAQTGAHVPATDNGRFADITPLVASALNVDGMFSDDRQSGRLTGLTSTPPDETKGQFRTPSLRGVAETGPYMHAGPARALSGDPVPPALAADTSAP